MEHAEIECLENALARISIVDEALCVAAVRARHRGEEAILDEIQIAQRALADLKLEIIKRRWHERPATLRRIVADDKFGSIYAGQLYELVSEVMQLLEEYDWPRMASRHSRKIEEIYNKLIEIHSILYYARLELLTLIAGWAYGSITRAEWESLPPDQRRTINDDSFLRLSGAEGDVLIAVRIMEPDESIDV